MFVSKDTPRFAASMHPLGMLTNMYKHACWRKYYHCFCSRLQPPHCCMVEVQIKPTHFVVNFPSTLTKLIYMIMRKKCSPATMWHTNEVYNRIRLLFSFSEKKFYRPPPTWPLWVQINPIFLFFITNIFSCD